MIPAWWYISNNFGDNLNHFMIKAISGQPVIYTERNKPHNIVCGSILAECNEHSTVWGPGFGNKDQRINTKHADIKAVRGEMSRRILGIDCPVGDPALLLPRYYSLDIPKVHKIGIIPHYADYGATLRTSDHYVIDPFQSTKDFIGDVLSCEAIQSSSLHGLIVADAYGIPNTWLPYGDEFKYRDYYSTTDKPKEPLQSPVVSRYKYSLDDLLNACPFGR
jgi:pyruvyltransferase